MIFQHVLIPADSLHSEKSLESTEVSQLSLVVFKPVTGHLLNHPYSEALTVIVAVSFGSSPALIHALKRNGII